MITCLAIDDEPLALKQLENYIRKTPFLELSASCHSASEARTFLNDHSVDVIFTDINMPDCSGLQFVKELVNPPLVVFSTAYEEYAIESFRIDAIDYLLKPYGYQDFLKAAMKVKQYHEWQQLSEDKNESHPTDEYFFVRADNKSVKIIVKEIVYVEAMSEYIRIHLKGGKSIMTFMSIKLMMDTLPQEHFMRIHRSHIVALEEITTFRRNEVETKDGIVLPVSASYKEELQKYIDEKTILRK